MTPQCCSLEDRDLMVTVPPAGPHGSSRLLTAPHRSSRLLTAPHRSSPLLTAPHRSSPLLTGHQRATNGPPTGHHKYSVFRRSNRSKSHEPRSHISVGSVGKPKVTDWGVTLDAANGTAVLPDHGLRHGLQAGGHLHPLLPLLPPRRGSPPRPVSSSCPPAAVNDLPVTFL
ncbi:hypothetical protein EYF80_058497 [Liparis tanakae]|uniref:Uncharacterized protein n=1 Tax=Liparis tanakae TaxID=230148 RepID=A0A4Z2ERE8_9TELE|nr:hypothetical protein EYF80_058497 [Liparis tanakae]